MGRTARADDRRRDELRGQAKKLRRGAIKRSRGTPGMSLSDADAICGHCHNTGVIEIRGGGWRACHCGQSVLT